MAHILCIETATTNCSVALGKNRKFVSLKEDYNDGYSHAERLHLFIEELLTENDLKPQDLDAIAVSKGPGSYTGLRIGVSAAKGLCFSLEIPLISVPTLRSLASQVPEEAGDFIIPLLDARRMEVYTAGFTGEKKPVFETRAEILKPESFETYLNQGKVTFIGNGVEKFEQICTHSNARFLENKLPSAKNMISLSYKKYEEGNFENVAYFEPYYLKDFMAG